MSPRVNSPALNVPRTAGSGTTASDRGDETTGPHVSGLVQGGLGGPDDELLESGQEEVFSRTEVETGRIEHKTGEDAATQSELRGTEPEDDRS